MEKEKTQESHGQGTLTLVLSWEKEAAGRTFQAIVPLSGLHLDGGREGVRFSTLQDMRICGRRRGWRVALLENDINRTITPPPYLDGTPRFLCFSVQIPEGAGAGTNKLISFLGRIGTFDVPTEIETGVEPPHEFESIPLKLTTANGGAVDCKWSEMLI